LKHGVVVQPVTTAGLNWWNALFPGPTEFCTMVSLEFLPIDGVEVEVRKTERHVKFISTNRAISFQE